jgi:hypothetical protein
LSERLVWILIPPVHLRDPATPHETEARILFGLPRSDGERQDEVVVGTLAPVELGLDGLGLSCPARTPDSFSSRERF